MRPFDLLLPGEINPDLILSGDVEPQFGQAEKRVDSAHLTVGSSSVITACGAARLGLKVAFIGICGADLFGRFMLEEMQLRGVDTSAVLVDPLQATGLTVILNKGHDRAMLTFPGAIAALRADQVSDDLLRRARHLHVASYFLQDALRPGLPDLFHRARALGLTTSLDTNWDPAGRWEGVLDLLPLVDVFLPNAAEACALSGETDVTRAARRLADLARTVAVKLGAEGALSVHAAQTIHVPSIPVDVVDTVGAGDTFDAGFLYGYLHGWTLEKSLRLAAICGALSTRAAGGVAAQPTLDEVITVMDGGR
ncbi:MAG: carbohydrate kinase [Candidatus Thermofonsia Clade 3 bacterium]|jgi:sugar/nucleoside kinase (ribokinase family)|uniref:Carbohydrate kinase n=2 Tax=Candidatus Thermofonsia Clade 3 TaxID=2364209 RepID=A0A2M8QBR1_9CHLR|nr:MAG: carbohydrate kinase [Candidatus Thermofonsia Clade 3 bacterium]